MQSGQSPLVLFVHDTTKECGLIELPRDLYIAPEPLFRFKALHSKLEKVSTSAIICKTKYSASSMHGASRLVPVGLGLATAHTVTVWQTIDNSSANDYAMKSVL